MERYIFHTVVSAKKPVWEANHSVHISHLQVLGKTLLESF